MPIRTAWPLTAAHPAPSAGARRAALSPQPLSLARPDLDAPPTIDRHKGENNP
jgi:hypothetical protein